MTDHVQVQPLGVLDAGCRGKKQEKESLILSSKLWQRGGKGWSSYGREEAEAGPKGMRARQCTWQRGVPDGFTWTARKRIMEDRRAVVAACGCAK